MSQIHSFEIIRELQSSRPGVILARTTLGALALVALFLILAPWIQTADGTGRVVAYSPTERQQNLEAPIEGRVLRWHVREGTIVKKGDPILEITDNDPEILTRLRSERDAALHRISAAKTRVQSVDDRIDSLYEARKSALSAADSRTQMAKQRLSAAEHALTAAQASLETARLNMNRQNALFEKGLVSKRAVELAELEITKSTTDVERAKAAVEGAKSEILAQGADQGRVGGDTGASINDARASRAAAEAEIAAANGELARIEVRLARQSTQSVTAPRDGTIFRIVANAEQGQVVKAGELVAVLLPDTQDRAVELMLRGNDIPLVQNGQRVRLQFEGWPALQFSGWPSVAVGTFAGKIALVDSTDNGKGLFRVLVVSDGEAWPDHRYLRQGVRANGWVQLGNVRLGYELWRQFNGFPPAVAKEPGAKVDASEKKE